MRKLYNTTIRARIMKGYVWVISVIFVLVISSLGLLMIVRNGYRDIDQYRGQQCKAQEVITAHYKWLDELNASILNGVAFEGSIDPNTCSLGKWLNNTDHNAMNDAEMNRALEDMIEPHKEIHAAAAVLVELSRTDWKAAFDTYTAEVKPKVVKIGEDLSVISSRYEIIAGEKMVHVQFLVIFSFVLCSGLGVLAVLFAVCMGTRISKRIAEPIVTVAKWSQAMATGVENLSIDKNAAEQANGILEIEQMIHSFQEMADSIRSNVDVIKRVAQGDLTAFVDIRSDGDSLGANLYHLVQNNDMMFAQLLLVADSVAENAGSISKASQSLASSASNQAGAVDDLSSTVNMADDLARENAGRANLAAGFSNEIRKEIQLGSGKMASLVESVGEIKLASDKISGVMKAIDDIAFQTNILALNAAVEAARAGSAGKGFAVVADEVRNLALKSAKAAKESAALIENTIVKTQEGSRISQETFVVFEQIVAGADKITNVVREIAGASDAQQRYIEEINGEIRKISEVVAGNAATSEETAAATQEMDKSAETIRKAMRKFNLRKREQDKPYIPKEKENDEEFIRKAYENFRKAKENGITKTYPAYSNSIY